MELRGHVAKALRCPNANHVLQKCIATVNSEYLQFIIDELLGRSGLVTQAARHRYGCRIVQQLLKKCSHEQVQGIAGLLLEDATMLSCHSFGNFVMQHLLEYGTEDQRLCLIRTLECDVAIVSK